MYFKVPSEGADSQRFTNSRAFKVGLALLGGSCLVLLSVMAISPLGTSTPEPTDLLSQRLPMLSQTMGNVLPQIPGPSPWKQLALAGIEASNQCGRDVSANAHVKSVLENMDSQSKAIVVRATQEAITKAQDLKAGQTAPMGFFDPWGLSTKVSPGRLLFYREAELKHGRVCMLASLGFLVGDAFHPLFGNPDVLAVAAGGGLSHPIWPQFDDAPLEKFWTGISLALLIPEIRSMNDIGSGKEKYGPTDTFEMPLDRVPGDLGFDPLNMKPKDAKGFLELQNKELNNGRLAMFAIAGMIGQELATGKHLFD